jgi:hypothetical protein
MKVETNIITSFTASPIGRAVILAIMCDRSWPFNTTVKDIQVLSVFYPLISLSDIFSINQLILILKIIGQCDVKHVMMLPIKIITSIMNTITCFHIFHLEFERICVLIVFECERS